MVEVFPASRAERLAWASVAAVVEAFALAEVPIDRYRLIGGAMVTLHVRRLDLDQVIIRATADADVGLPLGLLTEIEVPETLSNVFDDRPTGNRWTSREGLTVDVLVHDSRASRRLPVIGGHQFDRAVGLHVALRRPPILLDVLVEGKLTTVPLPDTIGALALKLGAVGGRSESKDLDDVWRLLEVAVAEEVADEELRRELGPIERTGSGLWELRRLADQRGNPRWLDERVALRLRLLAARYTAS